MSRVYYRRKDDSNGSSVLVFFLVDGSLVFFVEWTVVAVLLKVTYLVGHTVPKTPSNIGAAHASRH